MTASLDQRMVDLERRAIAIEIISKRILRTPGKAPQWMLDILKALSGDEDWD